MELDNIRNKINEIDKKMAKLFEERMELVSLVAKYKKENNLNILDSKREQEVINNNKKLIENENLINYYEKFLKELMDISKEYQKDLNK